jgi:[ribosomal protein S18]-alanine N-acetyltransferase
MRKLLLAHSGWSALLATNLQIRNASAADIAGMIALERVATTAGRWAESQYHEMFEPGAPARLILILEGEGRAVLGFLVAREAGDEWELENLVIAAEVQRRGHAADLLKRFMEHARCSKAQSVHLEVRESNRAARALYEKWGLVETGRRRAYYRDPPEDAILYNFCFQPDRT